MLFVCQCRDHFHCPAPFAYFVWQKGYFHPLPLTVGILNPSHVFLISATNGNKRRNLMLKKILYHRSLPSVT